MFTPFKIHILFKFWRLCFFKGVDYKLIDWDSFLK